MKAKMCFLILSFLIGSVSLGSLCQDGKGFNPDFFTHTERPDDFVPYPWGAELPFPWMKAQGLWVVNVGNTQTYYTFDVVRQNQPKERQLLIKQYDSKTCEIVAIGVGVENERNTIWALMKPMFLPQAYRLGLRNFSADALPKNLPNMNGRVMVLSVSTGGSLKSRYYPLEKVEVPQSSQLFRSCMWTR